MAEGLLRELGGGEFEAWSAGTAPSIVNPLAIRVMQERGIDISGQRSKHLDEFRAEAFDDIITVCDNAAEACPVFRGKARRKHWSFPDPAAAKGSEDEKLAVFRRVRDDIERHLKEWVDVTAASSGPR